MGIHVGALFIKKTLVVGSAKNLFLQFTSAAKIIRHKFELQCVATKNEICLISVGDKFPRHWNTLQDKILWFAGLYMHLN